MNEPLQSTQPYPIDRSFVIKLHRDANVGGGELRGRIVHLVSDRRIDFVGADGMVRTLASLIQAALPLAGPTSAAAGPRGCFNPAPPVV